MSWFKKPQIHEPVEKQNEEVLSHVAGPLAASGEDCDEMAGATGPFGHSCNNPIPVNAQLGSYKYLTKLRTLSGAPLLFHRLGSMSSSVSKYSVDVYEVVGIDGSNWDVLFVEMYHPRRSNKAPSGYTLTRYDPRTGDSIFGYGVDVRCPNFPYDLPDAILAHNGFKELSLSVREAIGITKHLRPGEHLLKVNMLSSKLEGCRTW